jgi:hypothetical protein
LAVEDFNGDTFVAFTDISGFKEMMKGNGMRAIRALDRLNTAGFNALHSNEDVNGFFVSDCGILFVRNQRLSQQEMLVSLLRVTERINHDLLNEDIMLTTSIAYGPFSYHQRIEFNGIEKNPIFGNAYVSAFLDNETGSPRIQPGQCRIISQNLPDALLVNIPLLKKQKAHFYHYWMVEHPNEIEDFERQYHDTYQLKYRGMLSALKRNNV